MKRPLLLLLSLFVCLFSCQQEDIEEMLIPNPEFTIDSFYAANEIVIIKEVTKADSYLWEFGNGKTSTDSIPGILTFSEPGIYSIKLTTSYQTSSGLVKRSTEKQIKIGRLYAYEVQLLNYSNNYSIENGSVFGNGSVLGPSEGDPDVYMEIYDPNDRTKLLYKSNVIPRFSRMKLPFTWTINPTPLPISAAGLLSFPEVKVFDSNTDKADRLIAHNMMTGVGFYYEFDKVKNEGKYYQQRGQDTDTWGSHIVIKYRIKLP